MGMGQNLYPSETSKIAGKWMFIPPCLAIGIVTVWIQSQGAETLKNPDVARRVLHHSQIFLAFRSYGGSPNHPCLDGIFMDFPLETIQLWGTLW